MTPNDTQTDDTEHKTVGEIDGHEVVVKVKGPEAQALDDDSRMGSDVVMSEIGRKLTEIKRSVDTEVNRNE